jgi:hypothetical protein
MVDKMHISYINKKNHKAIQVFNDEHCGGASERAEELK